MNNAHSVGFNLPSHSSSSLPFSARVLGVSAVASALSSALFGFVSAQGGSAQELVARNAICPAAYSPFVSSTNFPFEAPAQVKTACRPTPIDSYFGGIERLPKSPLDKTPQYVHQLLHPGVSYSPDGKFGYPMINGIKMTQSKLNEYHQSILNEIKRNPAIKQQVHEHLKTVDPDSKGLAMALANEDGSPLTILIGVSPLKMKNHKAAISSLRSWVGRIGELSPQEITAKLLKAHELLFNGLMKSAGSYRRADACIFKDNDEDQDRSFEGLSRLLVSRGGTRQDVQVLKKILNKNQQARGTMDHMSAHLTEKEKKVLSFLCFVIPDFQNVPNLMREFAVELQKNVQEMDRCGKHDPIALGAFVHQKIGAIHPCDDGNGRMARAFMNAILMENGLDPVIFMDDDAYTDAIEEDSRKPGHFAEYVRNVAVPQMEKDSRYLSKIGY